MEDNNINITPEMITNLANMLKNNSNNNETKTEKNNSNNEETNTYNSIL